MSEPVPLRFRSVIDDVVRRMAEGDWDSLVRDGMAPRTNTGEELGYWVRQYPNKTRPATHGGVGSFRPRPRRGRARDLVGRCPVVDSRRGKKRPFARGHDPRALRPGIDRDRQCPCALGGPGRPQSTIPRWFHPVAYRSMPCWPRARSMASAACRWSSGRTCVYVSIVMLMFE